MKMSDEQAARIHTVRPGRRLRARHLRRDQRDRPSDREPGPDRCASSTTCWSGCRTTSPGRRSRTRPGPSGASDSYERLAFLGDSVLGAGRHDAPVPAAGGRHLRRRPADEDPRAGGLRPLLPGGRGAARDAGAAARRGAAGRRAGPATEQLARTERVLASVIEAVIGACYLDFGYERTAEAVVEAFPPEIEQALEHPADFKSALQERLARRGDGRDLRESRPRRARRTSGPSRSRRWSAARRWRAAPGARRRTPSRPRPRRRWSRWTS